MVFSDPLASVRAPTQQELRIADLFTAYNTDDMDRVARVDEREQEHHKWEAYHRNVRKYRAIVSNSASSKDVNTS